MIKYCLTIGLLCLSIFAPQTDADERTWISADRKQRIKAEFVGIEDDVVQLQVNTGQYVSIPLAKFCRRDQLLIERLATSQTAALSTGDETQPAQSQFSQAQAGAEHPPMDFSEPLDSSKGLSGADFDKYVKPDHQTLLKMYYKAHGEVLREHLPFAMEVYTALHQPSMVRVAGTLSKSGFDQEWFNNSQEYYANEFTRRKIEQQVTTAATKALNVSGSWRSSGVFRLQWQADLERYNFETQTFPLSAERFNGLNYSTDSSAHDKIPVPRAYLSASARREFGKTKADAPIFRRNFLSSPLLPVTNWRNGRSSNFTLAVSGLDGLTQLPLAADQAERLLSDVGQSAASRGSGRAVIIEGLVHVGPITISQGELDNVPARLLAARALHPVTGKEIHRFSVDPVEAPASVASADEATQITEVPEMTRLRMALLQLREQPELLDTGRLDELTRDQIRAEQQVWQQIDGLTNKLRRQQQGINLGVKLNPKQPFFTYSWYELQTTRSDLANGPLLEVFSGNDRSWAFLRDEPNWDTRFDAVVAPFLFSRSDVEGKSIESAKVALLRNMKSFAEKVASKVPNRLAIPVALSKVALNAERTALVADPRYTSGQSAAEFRLLDPVHQPTFGEPGREPGFVFPKSMRDRMLYRVRGFPENTDIDRRVVDLLFSGDSGHRMGFSVSQFRSGAKFLTNYPAAVALDREIVFDSIPLKPEVVSALTDGDYLRNHSGGRAFEARIIVNSLNVQLARDVSHDGTSKVRGVIVGDVEGVQVVSREGQAVAFIPASKLPKSRIHPDNDPFTPDPTEKVNSAARAEKRELTPAMIPLLIARHQPEFFESHLDQFVVTRLQHEHWFRKEPQKNVYGVDPSLGSVFPTVSTLPDAEKRRALAGDLRTWARNNSQRVADRFTMRFADLRFDQPYLKKTPAPALIGSMHSSSPFGHTVYSAGIAYSSDVEALDVYKRLDPRSAAYAERKREFAAWKQALSRAPREIYFSQRRYQFVVTDSSGNRSLPKQGASMGGGSSGGIAGIPTATPATEPVFPLLQVNQQIWLPENAEIDSNSGPLQLEVSMEIRDVEISEQPLPHPWIEAALQYCQQSVARTLQDYRADSDGGLYAVIQVDLKSAQLINAATGETVLPLVLKQHPVAMTKSR